MKLKYYLRGLGLGIIFTSIILAVAYGQNKGLTTDSEVMKRASELGMVSTETESNGLFGENETENSGTETEGESLINQQESASQSETQTSQQEPVSQSETQISQQETDPQPEVQASQQEDTSQQVGEQANQPADSQQTSEQPAIEEPEYVVINVVKGEVCRQIAEDLQAHGLIDDAESFRKYMQEKNYDNAIRVGSIPIKKGATYEEIAISLTTKQ